MIHRGQSIIILYKKLVITPFPEGMLTYKFQKSVLVYLPKYHHFSLNELDLKNTLTWLFGVLVIHTDYHLIDVFCLDVLSILHHALWPCQLGGDVLMHGNSK